METTPTRAVEDCLIELFQALGLGQAHIAAGQLAPSDWLGLAAGYPERVASLILVSPRPRPKSELNGPTRNVPAIGVGHRMGSTKRALRNIRRDPECDATEPAEAFALPAVYGANKD